ncbi:hypothetical protein NR798_10985 [Archangium gephyra]|uniref:hypothetical protein n=1 Tax=Archangium gephyra TaxID=48 RepID=UPI0035D48F69
MNTPSKDPRAQLTEELRALIQQNLEEELKATSRPRSLARLNHLLSLADRIAPERKKPINWIPVIAVSSAAFLIALLATIPTTKTEIELSVKSSQFSAALNRSHTLFGNVDITSLTASGVKKLRVPDQSGSAPNSYRATEKTGGLNVDVSLPDPKTNSSTLSLNPIIVPDNTELTMSAVSPYQAHFAFEHAATEIQADLLGTASVSVTGARPVALSLSIPDALRAYTQDDFQLEVATTTTPSCIICLPTPVSKLSFEGFDDTQQLTSAVVTPFSSIISGSLVMEELNDKDLPLRAGTHLTLQITNGEVRSATLDEKGQISVIFHGEVSSIKMGLGSTVRELKPSLLEWLAANRKLHLLWSSVIFLFGLVLSTARWYTGQT